MVAPIYSNKKGIYKDLYREIDTDRKKQTEDSAKKPPKGIYANLYNQFEIEKNAFKNNQKKDKKSFILTLQKKLDYVFSKIYYLIPSARSEIKMLILTLMIAKKPINSYIENNLQAYSNQGNYYNDR